MWELPAGDKWAIFAIDRPLGFIMASHFSQIKLNLILLGIL